MSPRPVLVTLGFVVAGAAAFILTALGTVVLLADADPGASDGAAPATASRRSDQVALRPRSTESGGGTEPGGSAVKARAYFLDEIPRR